MKQTATILVTALAAIIAVPTGTHAGMVGYNNLDNTDNLPFISQSAGRPAPSIDDLQVANGGTLNGVSFSLIAGSLGGPVDADILLALDDGDGVPNFLAPGSTDSILLQRTITGINGPFGFLPTGDATIVDVDVSGDNVSIPNGSTIWALANFTRGGFPTDVSQVFFGPIAAGTSDDNVYQIESDGSISAIATGNNPTDAGLGWSLTLVPEPTSALLLAAASIGLISRRKRNPMA